VRIIGQRKLSVNFNLILPAELYVAIEKYAQEIGVRRNAVIRAAITEFLEARGVETSIEVDRETLEGLAKKKVASKGEEKGGE